MRSPGWSLLNALHGRLVFSRRVEVLAAALSDAILGGGRLLDVGCGDGQVAAALMARRADIAAEGVDVLIRPATHIEVTAYDGRTLPYVDGAFDYVTLVDVLHHTDEPVAVLREAARVARRGVVVKDHLREGFMAEVTLRLMDWVGNRGHGVRLPYNYLDGPQWRAAFAAAGLGLERHTSRLDLYAAPLSWFFERRLHFVALLLPHENERVPNASQSGKVRAA